MALQTKTISKNASNGHHKFTLTVTENSTSTSNNSSSISWTFKLSSVVSGYDWRYSSTVPVTYTVTINGTKYTGNIMSYDGSSTVTVKSGSNTISHSTDGTKTISYSFSVSSISASYLPGSASASGSMTLTQIPRYATSNQSLTSKTETTITMNWSSDSIVDYIWYSKDNGSTWEGMAVTEGNSGSYTIYDLSANTTYNIKTRVRRKDSQLTTDSSALSVTTYNYPHCTNAPSFVIGNTLTLTIYNPLGRSYTFTMLGADGSTIYSNTYTGTSASGFSGTSITDKLYKSIPNAKSGTYKIRVTYGSNVSTVTGGTYSIKGTETPTVGSLSYADMNTTVTAITKNNQHIVQNQSNLVVTYGQATGNNGASISKYTFELNGVTKTSTSYDETVTFGQVNSASDLTLTMTVTDSRGLTAKATKTITFLAHSKPTALVTLERLNNYEDETYLTIDGSVSSVNGKNTMAIKYRYKVSGGSYNSFVTVGDNSKQTLSLNKNNSYIFNVVVTDAFGSIYDEEHALGKGVFPLFIDTELNSVGINTLPTKENALEIGGLLVLPEKVLWSGNHYMMASQQYELSEPVSKQTNGVMLVFSYFKDGSPQNQWWSTFFVPKTMVRYYTEYGISCTMSSPGFGIVASKYIYVSDTVIKGADGNESGGTSNGIVYNNSAFVLRYVLGV